jgi:ATP synthase protein I
VVETPPRKPGSAGESFSQKVSAQERRKLRAARTSLQVWSWLGASGLIGWSIGAPTVLGALTGVWLDKRHPGARSWTLTLLLAGLCLGCVNAWLWISREQREIHREEDDK